MEKNWGDTPSATLMTKKKYKNQGSKILIAKINKVPVIHTIKE